jgi:hypothetical protein
MSQSSVEAATEKVSAVLDEIEKIGIKAETEGRNLNKEEVARIEKLSKQFDACEKIIEAHPSQ